MLSWKWAMTVWIFQCKCFQNFISRDIRYYGPGGHRPPIIRGVSGPSCPPPLLAVPQNLPPPLLPFIKGVNGLWFGDGGLNNFKYIFLYNI